jgi:hypothetical protein
MSVLLLDLTAVEKTWASIEARISRRPVFQVVPDIAMLTIESVVLANEDEACRRWPTYHIGGPASPSIRHDARCRVQFAKEALLDAVPTESRGLFAVYFHEYIAASLRGDAPEFVYLRRSSSPAIAQRALAEAYQTCAAGMDEYAVEWNS